MRIDPSEKGGSELVPRPFQSLGIPYRSFIWHMGLKGSGKLARCLLLRLKRKPTCSAHVTHGPWNEEGAANQPTNQHFRRGVPCTTLQNAKNQLISQEPQPAPKLVTRETGATSSAHVVTRRSPLALVTNARTAVHLLPRPAACKPKTFVTGQAKTWLEWEVRIDENELLDRPARLVCVS